MRQRPSTSLVALLRSVMNQPVKEGTDATATQRINETWHQDFVEKIRVVQSGSPLCHELRSRPDSRGGKMKTRPGGQPDGSSHMGAWGGWALAPDIAMGRDYRSHMHWSPLSPGPFKAAAIFLTLFERPFCRTSFIARPAHAARRWPAFPTPRSKPAAPEREPAGFRAVPHCFRGIPRQVATTWRRP